MSHEITKGTIGEELLPVEELHEDKLHYCKHPIHGSVNWTALHELCISRMVGFSHATNIKAAQNKE